MGSMSCHSPAGCEVDFVRLPACTSQRPIEYAEPPCLHVLVIPFVVVMALVGVESKSGSGVEAELVKRPVGSDTGREAKNEPFLHLLEGPIPAIPDDPPDPWLGRSLEASGCRPARIVGVAVVLFAKGHVRMERLEKSRGALGHRRGGVPLIGLGLRRAPPHAFGTSRSPRTEDQTSRTRWNRSGSRASGATSAHAVYRVTRAAPAPTAMKAGQYPVVYWRVDATRRTAASSTASQAASRAANRRERRGS